MDELKMWEIADGFLRGDASTVLSAEEKKIVAEAEKGGQGSGNFGHLGIDGQRGGSMPTLNPDNDLSYQERKDFDELKPSSQKDYIEHRNAGMDHDTAIALAEPSLAEALAHKREVVKMIIENGLVIAGVDSFAIARERLKKEGVAFDGANVTEKNFTLGGLPCAIWFEQSKELIISKRAELGVEKGGQGSGNFGHSGREGERGGSAVSDAGEQDLIGVDREADPYGVGAERAHAYGDKEFIALVESGNIKIGDKTDRGTVERHAKTSGNAWTMTMVDTGDDRRDIIETTRNTERSSANNYTKENADKFFDNRIKDSKEIDGRTYHEIGKNMEKSGSGEEGQLDSNMIICKTDDSKRMVYGIFLYPEEADHDGDVISSDDIEKVAHGFMADYRTIDEMHKDVIEATIVESCIAWKDDLEIYGKVVKKGTWFGAVKVIDDKVWEKVKNGTYKGFSVRISGVRENLE